jgi:hypothetical protein
MMIRIYLLYVKHKIIFSVSLFARWSVKGKVLIWFMILCNKRNTMQLDSISLCISWFICDETTNWISLVNLFRVEIMTPEILMILYKLVQSFHIFYFLNFAKFSDVFWRSITFMVNYTSKVFWSVRVLLIFCWNLWSVCHLFCVQLWRVGRWSHFIQISLSLNMCDWVN